MDKINEIPYLATTWGTLVKGSKVRLRNGGPYLTVESISDRDSAFGGGYYISFTEESKSTNIYHLIKDVIKHSYDERKDILGIIGLASLSQIAPDNEVLLLV